MRVGIDDPGRYDLTRRIDHLRRGAAGYVLTDAGYLAVSDENVGAFQITVGRCHHGGVLDQDLGRRLPEGRERERSEKQRCGQDKCD